MDESKFKLSEKLCPKCKKNFLLEDRVLNSLSRTGEFYICNDCGEKESLENLKKGTKND